MASAYEKVNPYLRSEYSCHGTFFKPDDYRLSSMLVTLPPMALRVLVYAMAYVEADGSVELSPSKMAQRFQSDSSYIAKGIRELVRHNFMAYKTRSVFWLSPTVAKPLTINLK